ncbi:MAG: twin-arginine translocase subunit TatB [Gammaproteobacteria bacterium]|nr:twin-arginine translocase subunit TatB [Gammaproteobacteria bacterium]MYD79736.1 twin-arginine translocase subunit TatB [Gammaproteobacteria bacterium]
MLDIGWLELLVIFVLLLVVLGPARLPEVARTMGLWLGRLRRMYNSFKLEMEREIGMDDVRRQLHNEQIMSEMKTLEQETKSILSDTQNALADPDSKPSNPPHKASQTPSDVDSPTTKATQSESG